MIDLLEPKKVGRKKKDVPSDYVATKIPKDVWADAKLISLYTGEEMAVIIGNICRVPIRIMADEALAKSRAAQSTPAPKKPKPK